MKILGLDLGVGSIGWALIETDSEYNPLKIIGMGSRIISLTPDESNNFDRGNGETVCKQRTAMRTSRKGNQRFKMRRAHLKSFLESLGIDISTIENIPLSPLQLWELRANAATPNHCLTLSEIGRVLMLLNQKRGYRHAKSDGNDAKQTEYVKTVNQNYAKITEKGMTIGQYLYSRLLDTTSLTPSGARVSSAVLKGEVFPRAAYQEEFDRMMETQRYFYPEVFTDSIISELKDIIYFQRPLKSCKHLVSICEFEKRIYLNNAGNEVITGPRVAPKTSPIAQVTRLYEVINNLSFTNHHNRKNNKILPPSLFDQPSLPRDARLLQEKYILTQEDVTRYLIISILTTKSLLLRSSKS